MCACVFMSMYVLSCKPVHIVFIVITLLGGGIDGAVWEKSVRL